MLVEAEQYLDDGRLMRLLNEAAERLLAARDPNLAVQELFELIRSELKLDVYFNYVLDEAGDLRLANSGGLDAETRRSGAHLGIGVAVCGQVALQRRPIYVSGVQGSDDPLTGFIRDVGLDCYACTPMLAGDRLLGTLGFGRRWTDVFTPQEVAFLRTVTHYVAMAAERLRIESALRDSERRLNAVLDNASVAIFLMDDRQHCAYMNAAAERLTGYRFEETQGRPLHDVIHHTRPDGSHFPLHECAIDRAFPENNNQTGEEVFVRADGTFYPVAFTASPIRDEGSKTIGTIIEVRDISAEKRNEQARELLMREVDHRARNTLAIVQSLMQLTRAETVETYREIMLGRVSALGRAQGSLAAERWEGASIRAVVSQELDALAKTSQVAIEGDDATLVPDQTQPLGMIIHELGTNAVKYGALSREAGRVRVSWAATPERLTLRWEERGGPPISKPEHTGFGSRLIATLTRQLRAAVHHDWSPEGLVVTLTLPRLPPTS